MFIILVSSVSAINFTRHLVATIDSDTVFAIDLDGDGDKDIVSGGSTVNILLNNGLQGFVNTTIADATTTNVFDIFSADVDSDGDNDIVYNSGVNIVAWFENDGSENFQEINISTQSGSPRGIYAIDMNNDNTVDIVSTYVDLKKVVYFSNDGDEIFTEVNVQPNVAQSQNYIRLDVNDIDNDGDFDIIQTSGTVGGKELTFYESEGGITFTKHILSTNQDFQDAFVIDVDSDGDKDIVTVSTTNISWFENDGFQSFTEIGITSILLGTSIRAGDLDGDGDIDIVSGSSTSTTLLWLENNNQVFTNHTIAIDDFVKEVFIIDLDNDNDLDIVVAARNKAYWFKNNLNLLSVVCDFPSLFCDNFNYDEPLSTRNWAVEVGINIDNTFSPIGNRLDLTKSDNSVIARHETGSFPSSYRPDSGSRFTIHNLAPVFSSQFVLNFSNTTDNIFEYQADKKFLQTAYIIRAELSADGGDSSGNMDWFYLNDSENFNYKLICANCTFTGEKLNIKIISFFSQRDSFPFNSSVPDDEIKLYSDDILLGTIEDFLFGDAIDHLSRYHITKFNVGNFTIDDYFVMVGTDKDVSTIDGYFSDFFANASVLTDDIVDAQTGDMAQAISTIWDDMGLLSTTSKVMAGLFLMFFLAVVMFVMALKTNHPLSARVLIVVELFFMILLTFMRLLPIWLPFVVVLISAGIGAAAWKMGTSST